jgi:polar amino acid transport system substrate-binding protein
MKMRNLHLGATTLIFLLALLIGCNNRSTVTPDPKAAAKPLADNQPLLIVTEPWEPYIFDVDSPLKGMDYEVVEAVFREMKIPVKIEFYPFKRALILVQKQKADAILDLMVTPERKEFLYFPDEYISASPTTLFFRHGQMPKFKTLSDLSGYVMGTQLGFDYPKVVADAPLTKEEAPSLDSNLQKLILKRIDILVDNRTVVLYKAHQLGLLDKITYDPRPLGNPEETLNFLGFAKKEGYDQLAARFSAALKVFKTREEYRAILTKYAQK